MLFGGTTTTMMMMMSINAGCNECFGALNTEECISFTDWSRLLYGRMAAHTIRSLCRCWAIRCPTVCFGFCLPQLTTRKTRAITLHNKNKSYWLFFALALAASFQRNGIAGVSCWPSVSCGWPSARYAIHFFCLRAVFSFCFIFFSVVVGFGQCLRTGADSQQQNYEWNVSVAVCGSSHTFNLACGETRVHKRALGRFRFDGIHLHSFVAVFFPLLSTFERKWNFGSVFVLHSVMT